ncbi:MAG: Unknown protein [uncultured Sulfurovum sp.]|uniref:UspA domain-containing protein n=1 Tax=uncultured Sulfurovum sp. TaxID=269237 RepID=A0A6S6U2T0_9BACT|nr:MAG: Unknown protein [uncultured Sulfurovum sp.]
MQHPFKRIVILLNDLENMESLLQKGVSFANEHDTLLEVLFVHEVPLFEVPDYFLPDEKISESIVDKDKIKEKIEEHLDNLHLENEHAIFVYENDTIDRINTLIPQIEGTLILTQYHDELSSQLIEETPYTYWIIKKESTTQDIAFTIDLEDKFQPYLMWIKHIFPEAKIELIHNYRYMLDPLVTTQDYLIVEPLTQELDIEMNKVLREQKMETFNNYKNALDLEGTFLEGDGVFNDDIISYLQNKHFNLTVLCRDNVDIFFSSSLINEFMEKVSTDFFICQVSD